MQASMIKARQQDKGWKSVCGDIRKRGMVAGKIDTALTADDFVALPKRALLQIDPHLPPPTYISAEGTTPRFKVCPAVRAPLSVATLTFFEI